MDKKCIIILSTKSSGSSALQKLFTQNNLASHIRKTRHFENETLFWVNAASILGLPQTKMIESEVPVSHQKAQRDFKKYFVNKEGKLGKEDIFNAWDFLCSQNMPYFIEKSPHHLLQWSALSLMKEAMNCLPDIEFYFIGLIRNPMDVLYSYWKRWGTNPTRKQFEWQQEYKNLLKFKEVVGSKLFIVKYEDLIREETITKIMGHIEHHANSNTVKNIIHNESINKWKSDLVYGFNLDPKVYEFAESLGYSSTHLTNHNSGSLKWKLILNTRGPLYRTRNWVRLKIGI